MKQIEYLIKRYNKRIKYTKTGVICLLVFLPIYVVTGLILNKTLDSKTTLGLLLFIILPVLSFVYCSMAKAHVKKLETLNAETVKNDELFVLKDLYKFNLKYTLISFAISIAFFPAAYLILLAVNPGIAAIVPYILPSILIAGIFAIAGIVIKYRTKYKTLEEVED